MAKILVVEDSPKSLKHLAKAVRLPGSELATAASAKEAIQRIAEETFDVIVTDMQMETKEAGLDVLRTAKAKDNYTQVIVITAFGTLEVNAESMRLGAFDFLERNMPGIDVFELLKKKVASALEFRNEKLREGGLQ